MIDERDRIEYRANRRIVGVWSNDVESAVET